MAFSMLDPEMLPGIELVTFCKQFATEFHFFPEIAAITSHLFKMFSYKMWLMHKKDKAEATVINVAKESVVRVVSCTFQSFCDIFPSFAALKIVHNSIWTDS